MTEQLRLSPVRLAGTAAIVVLGVACYLFPFGAALERLSFDLPFVLRANIRAPEAVLVNLDEESARTLHQSLAEPWDRSLHVTLLDRLTRDGARLVYYDIVFSSASNNPQIDETLADAMRRNQTVILAGAFEAARQGGTYTQRVYPPLPVLREAAAGWGLVFLKVDPDFAVRKLSNGSADLPSASWIAAEKLSAAVTQHPEQRLFPRWLNYYGPAGTLPSVSFHQAVYADGVPPGYFKDKFVFVGSRPALGGLNLGRDEFANPYSRWGRLFSPGLEVHATEFLNLLRGDWLNRMPRSAELPLLLLGGVVIGAACNFMAPKYGMIAAFCVVIIVSAAALVLVWRYNLWFNWLIPVLVQVPIGLAWSGGSQYFHEAKRRAALRQAFSYYLSPQMADRIADSKFSLKPGGKVVKATVLFSDCKGFTSVSEELNDPLKLSELLIEYFTQTSRCVLDNDGTIIKYIGDSVMAAWGAPLDDPDHCRKATLAGLQMSEASKLVVAGRVLTTRIGISTGTVVAGNLGSPFRFDYTVIGDTVNFASRLEGLNKMLGTCVLISETTQAGLKDHFRTRLVGRFAVAGKSHGVSIYEVLSPVGDFAEKLDWLPIFAEGVAAIRNGEFEPAKSLFRKTIWDRGGEDGPSEFYLKKLADLEKSGRLAEWTGVIRLDEK